MTLHASIPLLVALAGALLYALASPTKLAELGRLAFLAAMIALLMSLAHCGASRDAFARDLAGCDLAPTCAEAVACRRGVAEKYNRPPSTVGHCEAR